MVVKNSLYHFTYTSALQENLTGKTCQELKCAQFHCIIVCENGAYITSLKTGICFCIRIYVWVLCII